MNRFLNWNIVPVNAFFKSNQSPTMLHDLTSHHRRGITGLQVILTLAVLSVGSAVLVVILNYASSGRVNSQCRSRLYALQTGIDLWAQGDMSKYPVPSHIQLDSDSQPTALTDSTANLHALMIFNSYYLPHMTVCPGEMSPTVRSFDDDQSQAVLQGDYRNDLTGGPSGDSWSNVSYANQEIRSGRSGWNLPSAKSDASARILFGDRGPNDGKHNANSWSYQLHSPVERWHGNLIFADGHITSLIENPDQTVPFGIPRMTNSKTDQPTWDNIFLPEYTQFDDDNFISIFRSESLDTGTAEQPTVLPIWD